MGVEELFVKLSQALIPETILASRSPIEYRRASGSISDTHWKPWSVDDEKARMASEALRTMASFVHQLLLLVRNAPWWSYFILSSKQLVCL